jgi:tRNA pseudouridine32 synthase/23S rRNA pseudouridine746 synthase
LSDTALTIIHADDTLLVLDKPAGLLCVPGRGADKQDCLSKRAQAQYPDALIVHRLDMATSGLVVMARSLAHQRSLSEAFAARQVHKRYVAVVAGVMAAQSDSWQTISLPLMPDWPRRPLQKVDLEHGKPSNTRWRLAPLTNSELTAVDASTTRVELEPVTGRTHQLRVHLAAIGHPVVGDAMYAPTAMVHLAPRLMLHATELQFQHPASGTSLAFRSPPPF